MDVDDDADPDLILPSEIKNFPIGALRITSRKKLASFLDLEGQIVTTGEGTDDEEEHLNNYAGVAELARYGSQALKVLERKDSPTTAFLDQWNGRNATIGNLWQFLTLLDRLDVLKACRRNILADSRVFQEQQELAESAAMFNIEQDPTVTNSEMKVDETKFATVDDVKNKEKTYYDAFLCYTTEDLDDREFAKRIIQKLEGERKLKLFIPGRDDLPGSSKHVINAYLIEERCRRIIILISKSFYNSEACDFQLKFAQALAPGARSKKLIPIVKDPGMVLPRILKFLATCDFTKQDMEDWVWDRLYTAIIAPIGKVTYFTEEDAYNPFKEITNLKQIAFPTTGHRLFDGQAGSAGSNNLANPVHVQSGPESQTHVKRPIQQHSPVRGELNYTCNNLNSNTSRGGADPTHTSVKTTHQPLNIPTSSRQSQDTPTKKNNLGKGSSISGQSSYPSSNSSNISNSQIISSSENTFSTNTRVPEASRSFHPSAKENSYYSGENGELFF